MIDISGAKFEQRKGSGFVFVRSSSTSQLEDTDYLPAPITTKVILSNAGKTVPPPAVKASTLLQNFLNVSWKTVLESKNVK